ncbi:GNAT family N-acetyltransferase [Micromonospora sp. BRA006-A]|nr:GNAT family N-acetyltransferase [Micromonospora sp. BRA006-A]
MIDSGHSDRTGRRVTLRPVDDDNWRAVADVAPHDEPRACQPRSPPATCFSPNARTSGTRWPSTPVRLSSATSWGVDDDESRWIGGMVIDAAEQGRGLGRATVRTLADWLAEAGRPIRLSYHPDNKPPPSTRPWASTPRARWRTTNW